MLFEMSKVREVEIPYDILAIKTPPFIWWSNLLQSSESSHLIYIYIYIDLCEKNGLPQHVAYVMGFPMAFPMAFPLRASQIPSLCALQVDHGNGRRSWWGLSMDDAGMAMGDGWISVLENLQGPMVEIEKKNMSQCPFRPPQFLKNFETLQSVCVCFFCFFWVREGFLVVFFGRKI